MGVGSPLANASALASELPTLDRTVADAATQTLFRRVFTYTSGPRPPSSIPPAPPEFHSRAASAYLPRSLSGGSTASALATPQVRAPAPSSAAIHKFQDGLDTLFGCTSGIPDRAKNFDSPHHPRSIQVSPKQTPSAHSPDRIPGTRAGPIVVRALPRAWTRSGTVRSPCR